MGNSGTSMTSSLNGGEPTIFNHSQCNNPDITATRVD